jgi:hypothetical protein
VPYLLGFHPRDSLVLIGFADGRVNDTARVDLTDLVHADLAQQLLAALRRGGAGEVVVVVFDDAVPDALPDAAPEPDAAAGAALPWRAEIGALAEQCERHGLVVGDVMLVRGGRWRSYVCTDPRCCPAEGNPMPAGTSPLAAAATYAGLVALPDRAALAATLDPAPEPDRVRLMPLISSCESAAPHKSVAGQRAKHDRAVKRAIFAAARRADEPVWNAADLDDDTVAAFGAALRSFEVRDPLWVALDHRRLGGDPLWRALAARLPAPYDATPLFLFGWNAWRSGDGALAGIAAERALESDPSYSAADLLLAALRYGMDPRKVPRMRPPRST